MLFRYAWHLMGSREDAEDATQAAFLSAHSALEQGTTPLEPRAWLLRIVRNECLTRLGERSRRPAMIELASVADPPAREPGVERQAELRGEVELARRLLGRLPSKQREAFVLREWVGCSQQEVALALGVSVASVEGLLGRARMELVRGLDARDDRTSCQSVREQLATADLSAAGRGHLLRCARCRAARRLLYPSRAASLARGFGVPALIAERLAEQLPGFSAGAAAGGGGLAAIGTKLASMPIIAKLAVGAATAVVAGGTAVVAVREHGGLSRPAPRAVAGDASRGGGSGPVTPASPPKLVAAAVALAGAHDDRARGDGARATKVGAHRVHGGSAHRVHGGEAHRSAGSRDGRSHRSRGAGSQATPSSRNDASGGSSEDSGSGTHGSGTSASDDDSTRSDHSSRHGKDRHEGPSGGQADGAASTSDGTTDQSGSTSEPPADSGTTTDATGTEPPDDSSTGSDEHAGTQTTP